MEKPFFQLAERFCKLVWAVSRLGKRFRKLVRAFSKLAEGLGYLGKRLRKLENRSRKSMNRKIALAARSAAVGGGGAQPQQVKFACRLGITKTQPASTCCG